MKMRTLAALVCLAALAQPVAATPILELRTGPNYGPDEVDAAVSPGSGEQFFDLTFLQDWEDPDDQMNRYDLIVRAPPAGDHAAARREAGQLGVLRPRRRPHRR